MMKTSLAPVSILLLALFPACSKANDEVKKASLGERASQAAPGVEQARPVAEEPKSEEAPLCPPSMVHVPEGAVWVGTKEETFDEEENPLFSTKVGALCVDPTEVTTAAYEDCVSQGKCTPAHEASVTCNTVAKGRGEHPINCVDHAQASAYCEAHDTRLPTEIEWEYLARGGEENRPYAIDGKDPEGRVCWKNNQSCPVKSFPSGPFGLYDLTGNVWEWTSDWFGKHPWPAEEGRHKIYKGGGWSRRFEKWLRPNLRNRLDPKKFGSHLGFRCVVSARNAVCPFGASAEGGCKAGVVEVVCLSGLRWNGVRCAKPGAKDRCPPGTIEKEGRGCVAPLPTIAKGPLDTSGVTKVRSPEFDADCRTNQPSRPEAFRYEGSGHLERNQVSKADGCKNRDVGVGFNSTCCP